jgi:hypothetical protein
MCIADKILRAMIDGELEKSESLAAQNHLPTCEYCRCRLNRMVELVESVKMRFSPLEPLNGEQPTDARLALNRFKASHKLSGEERYNLTWRARSVLAGVGRILTASISIPVPIAAAFVILFAAFLYIASRTQEPLIIASARAEYLPEPPRIVEIPVIREKVITQTVYIEEREHKDRRSRDHISHDFRIRQDNTSSAALTGSQISKEFERKMRQNERSLLERRTRYLAPNFGEPSIFRDHIPPVLWIRDMFDIDFLAKPEIKTRLIADRQFQPFGKVGFKPDIDFSQVK